jgi:GNAT superfamily N-acetyltransferase
MNDQAQQWRIRPALISNRTELSFILSTWLNCYRAEYINRDICNDVYYWHHHKLIEDLYARTNAIWVVACDIVDPSTLFGFCAGEATEQGPVLHFLFVKSKFRRHGVGKALLEELTRRCPNGPLVTTHMTLDFKRFRDKSDITTLYNPYVLWYNASPNWQKGDDDPRNPVPRSSAASRHDDPGAAPTRKQIRGEI